MKRRSKEVDGGLLSRQFKIYEEVMKLFKAYKIDIAEGSVEKL